MPPALKVNWKEIREAFQSGECGTTREAAERFGVKHDAVAKRAVRENWTETRNKVRKAVGIEAVSKKVVEKLQDDLATRVKARVLRLTERVDRDDDRIEETYEQLQPAADPDALASLIRARKVVIESSQMLGAIPLIERAPIAVTINASSPEFQAKMLAEIRTLRQMKFEGKLDGTPLLANDDVESVKIVDV